MKSLIKSMFIALAFVGAIPLGISQPLRVGQAVVDITPPLAMPFHVPQRPPFPVVPAEGTHDPLYAKAVVF